MQGESSGKYNNNSSDLVRLTQCQGPSKPFTSDLTESSPFLKAGALKLSPALCRVVLLMALGGGARMQALVCNLAAVLSATIASCLPSLTEMKKRGKGCLLKPCQWELRSYYHGRCLPVFV